MEDIPKCMVSTYLWRKLYLSLSFDFGHRIISICPHDRHQIHFRLMPKSTEHQSSVSNIGKAEKRVNNGSFGNEMLWTSIFNILITI